MRKFFFFSALLSAILFLGTDHLFFPKESRADSHQAPAPSAPVAESPAALTYVFECSDGTIFPARMEGNDAWLFLPGRTVKLPPVPSASGAKYSDHSIVFWTKGEEAFLQTEDIRNTKCKNNRGKAIWEDAKFRGVDFRARGNEPGWHLEITNGEMIVFVTDYGSTQHTVATPEPETEPDVKATVYQAKDDQEHLSVRIEGQPCQDTMSDNLFEAIVTVTLNDKTYRGCGRALH